MSPGPKEIRFAVPFRSGRAGARSQVLDPADGDEHGGDGASLQPAVRRATPTGAQMAQGSRGAARASVPQMNAVPPSNSAPPSAASTESNEPGSDALGDTGHRKGRRRSRTIPMRQLTREELLHGAELTDLIAYERPKSRNDCLNGIRPCPFVSCRHHLYLEVSERTGSIKLNFPEVPVEDLKETCALDVADRGGATLEEIGEIMNLTRERIRQLEAKGLDKLREAGFDVEFDGFFAEKRE